MLYSSETTLRKIAASKKVISQEMKVKSSQEAVSPETQIKYVWYAIRMLRHLSTKAAEESAIPPVVLSRSAGNLQHFRKNIVELQINQFWSMKQMLGKFLSEEYRAKIRANALAIHQTVTAAGLQTSPFPWLAGVTDPADVDLFKCILVEGYYNELIKEQYPEPTVTDPNEDREVKRNRFSVYREESQKRKEHNEELFNWIMMHLAPDSYVLITTPGDRYQALQRSSNVFGLWLLIEKYHTGLDTYTKAKRALMRTVATRAKYPNYASYMQEVFTNIAQLEQRRSTLGCLIPKKIRFLTPNSGPNLMGTVNKVLKTLFLRVFNLFKILILFFYFQKLKNRNCVCKTIYSSVKTLIYR